MALSAAIDSAVLYQNAEKTITLLDLPLSISQAQGIISHPCNDKIFSVPALQRPHPSTEPKSAKAKENVLHMKPPSDPDVQFPERLLYEALEKVAAHYKGEWCLGRWTPTSLNPEVDNGDASKYPTKLRELVNHPPESILEREEAIRVHPQRFNEPIFLPVDIDHTGSMASSNVSHITNTLFRNPNSYPCSLQYQGSHQDAQETYRIPPLSSFLMSRITEETAPALSMAALSLYPETSATAGRAQFDFVLLDPPWENRSARRGNKYETMQDSEPMEVLKSMLQQHIAPQGLVACWITNKADVRDAAIEAFEIWGVQLIEEWAWLKTTVHGEPVTEINGIWRKPYEILLVGKKDHNGTNVFSSSIERRLIVAVPDLHSRKPNIKTLIESILPDQYRGLEIFGRNLTAGWCTWGDECLKYAWSGYWLKDEQV